MSAYVLILISLSSATLFAAVYLAVREWSPYWDRIATKQMGAMADQFDRLALDQDKFQWFLRLWGISVVAIFVMFAFVFKMLPVAIVMTFLAYVAPRHILAFLISQRTKLIRDQLVGASVGVGNAVKAGLSLAQGLETVCDEVPKPLSVELQRIVFEFDRGRPLKEALEQVRQRLQLESFTLFALAIEAAIDRGGRLNEALDRISTSLQETQRLERKLEAETAAGRQAVTILTGFPGLFLGFFFLLDRQSTSLLFSTFSGQCVLATVIVLTYIGSRWASKIMNIEI